MVVMKRVCDPTIRVQQPLRAPMVEHSRWIPNTKDAVLFVKGHLATCFLIDRRRAGSLILPRRSRPRQAHAARGSFEHRRILRAVLTRRGVGWHPPRCSLTRLSRSTAVGRPGQMSFPWYPPPTRSATACAQLHRLPPSLACQP